MGGYRPVFDIGSRPFHFEVWMLPLVILPSVFFALTVTPQVYVDRFFTRGPRGRAGKAFAAIGFVFSFMISVTWAVSHFGRNQELKDAEKRGAFSVVAGCLEGFHPMPASGHDTERLRVAGRDFAYSDFIDTPAFNNAESQGGPIHPDSRVRIGSVDGDIIRLEVIDHACPKAPDLPVPAS
jgi:hypothetical protein